MKKLIDNFKENKGSITLYVLVAILFFVILIISMFTLSQKQKEGQAKEYEKIKAEYEKGVSSLSQEYIDMTGKILIELFYNDTNESYDNETWTNKDIKAKISYPNMATNKKVTITKGNNTQLAPSLDEVVAEENQKIIAEAKVEGKIKKSEKEIKYIDKIKPQFIDGEDVSSGKAITLNFTAKDIEAGIKSIKIHVDNNLNHTYNYEFNNDTHSGSKEEAISYVLGGLEEGTTYLVQYEIEDYAGNILKTEAKEVTTTIGSPVVQIVKAIKNDDGTFTEEIIGEYFSLYDAISDYSSSYTGYTSNNGGYKIKMLGDVQESNIISTDKDITLDLAGCIISSTKTALENNGKLKIIDSGRTKLNSEEIIYGKVLSTGEESTIINNKNAELTLGENDGTVTRNITIEATTNAIENDKDGIFNFYDGQIIGKPAINGQITETPRFYSPVSKTQNEREIVYLDVVSEAVARIGYDYFTTIQAAVDTVTVEDDKQVEIIMVNNATVTTRSKY